MQTLGPTMKVLVTAAVFLIMLARVNSVPLESVSFVVNVSISFDDQVHLLQCVSVCRVCVCMHCGYGYCTVS